MSKIFNEYKNNVDDVWYESSNIFYSKCIDHEDELKTLYVTFKNNTTYKYEQVNVFDYLKFREAPSQGSAFNKYIRKYQATKIVDAEEFTLESEQALLESLQDQTKVEHYQYVEIDEENQTIKCVQGIDKSVINLKEEDLTPMELIREVCALFNIFVIQK